MLDAELVESGYPLLQLGAVGAAEGDVIEPDTMLTEPLVGGGPVVLMDAE
jgi:hypothetical protein